MPDVSRIFFLLLPFPMFVIGAVVASGADAGGTLRSATPGQTFAQGTHDLLSLTWDTPGRYWLRVDYVVRRQPAYGKAFALSLAGLPDLERHAPRFDDVEDHPDSVDWSFDVSAPGQAVLRLVVEDGRIEIPRVTFSRPVPLARGRDFRVPNRGTVPRMVREEFQRLGRAQGLPDIRDDLLVIVCAEGGLDRVPPRIDEIVERLQPDFFDWIPVVPLAEKYGIRTSCGAMEYQEYYKEEGGQYWDRRWELFGRNGMTRRISGTLFAKDVWGTGGYGMGHAAPMWHEVWLESVYRKALPQWEAFCQDNAIGGISRGPTNFDDWNEGLFKEYLWDHFTDDELVAMGLDDPRLAGFRVRHRVHVTGATGETAWQDPVLRLYHLFRHQLELKQWADCMLRLRLKEYREGRPTLLYGNQGAVGYRPFGLALAPYTDIVELESIVAVWDEHVPQEKMESKLPLAAGNHRLPVWLRGPVTDMTQDPPWAEMSPVFWTLHLGEALSNGAIRTFPLGLNHPRAGDYSRKVFMDSEEILQVYEDYAAMLRTNRAVFSHSASAARVAVVYSFASQMWREAPWLGLVNVQGYWDFKNRSHELDDAHVPNDVLLFGHPMVVDDGETLARLDDYAAVLLPVADCVSDRQLEALAAYAAQGGVVFAADGSFTYDENRNPRADTGPAWRVARRCAGSFADAIAECVRRAGLETDAPAQATINPRWICGRRGLAFHCVNYAVDVHARRVDRPGPFRVTLSVPDGFSADAALRIAPGKPPVAVGHTIREGRLTVEVPDLDVYAVIVVCDAAVLKAENEAIAQRRAADVEAVKRAAAK